MDGRLHLKNRPVAESRAGTGELGQAGPHEGRSISVLDSTSWSTFLRRARDLSYRACSPVDRILRRLQGKPDLPPLWLRRHTGAVSSFLPAAAQTMARVHETGLLTPRSSVLDIGCGCGAMAFELRAHLDPDEGRYVGFDVHGPSIAWCSAHFEEDPRFVFELAKLASPYSTHVDRKTKAEDYRFPVDDESVDLVLAKSVFTHMDLAGVENYLGEISRVLRPATGRALVTFFLFERNGVDSPPALPYPEDPAATIRWKIQGHPSAAIGFDRPLIEESVTSSGLEIDSFIQGFWPGREARITGQDQLILRKAGHCRR